jgi:hypothetical protein
MRKVCFAVIASQAKQSIVPGKERMDCFASLAMTLMGCLKTKSLRHSGMRRLAQASDVQLRIKARASHAPE